MAVKTSNLQKRIEEDKDFLSKFKKGLAQRVRSQQKQGVSKEQTLDAIRKQLGEKGLEAIRQEDIKTRSGTDTKQQETFTTPGGTVFPVKRRTADQGDVADIDKTVIEDEDITQTPAEDVAEDIGEPKTLKDRVADLVKGKKTEEERLQEAREEAGRTELVELQKQFREEAGRIQEDLESIAAGLEAEGGAITNIASSRIREARSAPLREQLVSIVKGQELTSDNIEQLDKSLDAILKARSIDRQNQVTQLTNQIEASDLSDEEKNRLITQLGVQTARMKREDEIETFRQKEQVKAQIKQQEEESLATTGLTLNQNVTLGKITKNFGVKEDSLIAKSISGMLREGKSEQEINKILGLSTDAEGNFIDDTQFARREKLRKEFESKAGVKTYREAVLQHQGTIASLGEASGPGDVAAVFQFMKTLDPTSVVRESEFQQAAGAAGVLEQVNVGNIFQKFKNGAILGEKDSKTREAFVKTVNELFKIKKKNYDGLARQMIQQAIRDGVDPESVVLDLNEVPGASDLTRTDYNLLNDEEIGEIDSIYGATTSSGKTFNLDFNFGDQTSSTKAQNILGDVVGQILPKGGDNPILGLKGGSLTFRTNNPLAITATSPGQLQRIVDRFGAIPDLFSPDSADNLVLNFRTFEEGLEAGKQLLESKGNLTLSQLSESHTGTSAQGHKARVQQKGLDLNKRYQDLTDEEKKLVVQAFTEAEGFTKGEVIS